MKTIYKTSLYNILDFCKSERLCNKGVGAATIKAFKNGWDTELSVDELACIAKDILAHTTGIGAIINNQYTDIMWKLIQQQKVFVRFEEVG